MECRLTLPKRMTDFATYPKSFRVAQIILIWCWFLVYAVAGVTLMPIYRDNGQLAVASALARMDVSTEQLDMTLDAVLAYKDFRTEEGDVAEDARQVYQAIAMFATFDAADLAGVGVAWQYPSSSPKAPLSVVKYASLKDKAERCFEHKENDEPWVFLSREQWQASAEAISRLLNNISQGSEAEFGNVCAILHRLVTHQALMDGLSYKDMLKLARTVLAYTKDVDFAKLYVMDIFLGEGFCEAVGPYLDRLSRVAHRLDYDRMVDILFDMPNYTMVAYNLVQYVFGELALELDTCKGFVEALQTFGKAKGLEWTPIAEAVTALLNATQPTTQEGWDALTPTADSLLTALGLGDLVAGE